MTHTPLRQPIHYIQLYLVGLMVFATILLLRIVEKTKQTILNRKVGFSDHELFDFCVIFMTVSEGIRKSRKCPVDAIKLSISVLDDIQNSDNLMKYIVESARPHRVFLSLIAGHKYRRQFGLKHAN